MHKRLIRKVRRLLPIHAFVLCICVLGLLALTAVADVSWADDRIPLPQKKPHITTQSVVEAASGSVPMPVKKPDSSDLAASPKVVEYSLKDFAKAFLDIGAPAPAVKPQAPAAVSVAASGPIPTNDADLYARVFALQAEGKMDEAAKMVGNIKDKRLHGHVLFQRYMHPTAYKSSFDELKNWLAQYNDHPGADRVYKLAEARRPKGDKTTLKKPERMSGIARLPEPMMVAARVYQSPRERSNAEKAQIKKFRGTVVTNANRNPEKAHKVFREDPARSLLDTVEQDILQAHIAGGYMFNGQMNEALRLSTASLKRSGLHVPQAGWVAGLVSWKNGNYKQAARYFEIPARSPYASGWTAAGGSYWAARSHMKAGNMREVSTWLKRAQDHPRTFYGLIATRALGKDFDFNWDFPTFKKEYRDMLESHPVGARAMALVGAGQQHLAEAELLRVNPEDQNMRYALLSYAGYAQLPALAMRIASAYEASQGAYYDAALYPKTSWEPEDGFTIDPALIYAIMRQESRFDPYAESPSGAIGLMQLMPTTAQYVARRENIEIGERLADPTLNVALGEKYIEGLLRDSTVSGDMVSLLIAYNAGPGNLQRWKQQWSDVSDPLLFIELLPVKETRSYVERVLASYWIYRMRESLPTPTLNALAEGREARYADAEAARNGIRLASR